MEPKSFEETSKHEVENKAIEEEIRMIEKNETCELTYLPQNKDVIEVKWVYKTKLNLDGLI